MNSKTFNVQRSTFSVQRWCLLFAFAFLSAITARADFQIQYFLTITNVPAGLTSNLVVNIGTSTTRYWTNDASGAPSTSIQTTNSTAATATNLLNHLVNYPVYSVGSAGPSLGVDFVSTNTSMLVFTAPENTNLTVTFGGNWARGYYLTNTLTGASPILWPTNAISHRARTNAGNAIVNLLADTSVKSNAIPLNTAWLRNYTDTNTAQTLGNKTLIAPVLQGGRMTGATNLTGTNVALTNVVLSLAAIHNLTELNGYLGTLTNGVFWSNLLQRASISNAVIIGGNVYRFTNGYWTNGVFDSPKATNLISYGSISAPGAGTSSEQFGNGALASSDYTTSFGASSRATNEYSTAFGSQATAFGGGTVIGGLSTANTNSAAIGYGNAASGVEGVLLGANNDANGYYNTILIGSSLSASGDNQVIIGGASQAVTFGGHITTTTVSNTTAKGTTTIPGRVDFTSRANTALANGYNSGTVLGTNVYIRLSGASGAATNAGFAAGVDGTFYIIQIDNPGLSYTLLHDSGLEATAANRIYTGTGALLNSTNNPAMLQMIYDLTASRYRVLSFR